MKARLAAFPLVVGFVLALSVRILGGSGFLQVGLIIIGIAAAIAALLVSWGLSVMDINEVWH